MDQSQLIAVIEQLLERAKTQGASSAEASASYQTGLSVSVRLGDVETVEFNRDRGLSVTVYFGHRTGTASTSDIKPEAIRDAVDKACQMAKFTAEDPCSGLPDKNLLAWDYPELDLCHPWPLEAEQAITIAKQCEDAARQYDKRITNTEGAQVNSHQGLIMRANSLGFSGGYQTSSHSIVCSSIAQNGDGMQRDMWYTAARAADELEDVETVGRKASERAIKRLGGRKLKTQQLPVIFHAEVAAGLFGHMISAIRGGSLYRKTTFLLDYLNKQIFPEWLSICEQPHLKKAMGSAPFDREGVKTQDLEIIKHGVLQSYLLDSYSARRLEMQSTGHAGGVHNLKVNTGEQSLNDLIKQAGSAVLITELMGQGINGITGDYSRGAAGFWVENGEIQYPIEEITVASNLKRMFMGIQAIANDVDLRRNIRTGSVLIDNMTIAGE